MLQIFKRLSAGWLRVASEYAAPLKSSLRHACLLLRAALELCGGRVEPRQHAFDRERTVADNVQLYSYLVSIVGVTDVGFGNLDPKEMYNAFTRSKLSADESEADTVQWIDRIKNSLPVWYPDGYLVGDSEWPAVAVLIAIGYSPAGTQGAG